MNISDILKLPNAMPVPDFKGKIQKVYDLESKPGKDGTFTVQNLVLADDTGVIYAQLVDRDLVPKTDQGKYISLECYTSKQHGLTGVKVNKYKKKDGGEGINIKVTKSAIMQIEKLPASEIEFDPENKATPDNPKSKVEEMKVKGEAQINMVKKTEAKPPNWDNINLRKDKSMCIAYSKDLAVAGKIEVDEIIGQADKFIEYLYYRREKAYPDDYKDIQERESAENCEKQEPEG